MFLLAIGSDKKWHSRGLNLDNRILPRKQRFLFLLEMCQKVCPKLSKWNHNFYRCSIHFYHDELDDVKV